MTAANLADGQWRSLPRRVGASASRRTDSQIKDLAVDPRDAQLGLRRQPLVGHGRRVQERGTAAALDAGDAARPADKAEYGTTAGSISGGRLSSVCHSRPRAQTGCLRPSSFSPRRLSSCNGIARCFINAFDGSDVPSFFHSILKSHAGPFHSQRFQHRG